MGGMGEWVGSAPTNHSGVWGVGVWVSWCVGVVLVRVRAWDCVLAV